MSEQIQGWKEEYLNLVEKLSVLVSLCSELVNSENKTATSKLQEAHEHVSRLKEVKKNFSLELRLVKDRKIKKEYEAEASLLDGRVSSLVKELRGIQDKHTRSSLLSGSTVEGSAFDGRNTKGKGNDDLLDGASVIQDKTLESLSRTTALIAESQELGEATLKDLDDQALQIEDINADMSTITTNLRRAEKLIKDFGRRMATDKIIQVFAGINIVIMLVLVLYVLISGKSLSSIADDATGDSTGPSTTSAPTQAPTN